MENKEESTKKRKLQLKHVDLEAKYNEAKLTRRIVFPLTVTIFLLVLGMITGAFLYIQSALQPINLENPEEIEIEIPLGSGVTRIANILEENEIIKDATIFKYYVKFKNESGFQAGDYKLNQAMTFDEIIASLKTGRVYQEAKLVVTIPEGLRLIDIAKIIEDKVGYSEKEFMDKLSDQKYLESLISRHPTILSEEIFNEDIKYPLEGYLFPATYSFVDEKPSIEEIVETMLKKTESVVQPYLADIQASDMSVHEFLTMASLIEKEATKSTDRKTISSVFYNRLEIGMPLQTDPTVIYAFGEHKERLFFSDYEIEDPYNTYKIQGLPPGPIANAGEVSFEAALYPTSTNYYYFLATRSGEVLFSETFEEHNKKYSEHIGN